MRSHARFWFFFALSLVTSAMLGAADRKPNLILILADDFGFECVSANGGQSYQTPHLDRLAATGMRFENCHVQPVCTPTRVELMTGLYNIRNYTKFGVLDAKEITFAHRLKAAGYATGICGKWQLGRDKDLPQKLGFDDAFLWQHLRRVSRYAKPGMEHNGKELNYGETDYGPKVVNDFALDFITRHRERPFFLYYPMILTHDPFQPTPDSATWNKKGGGGQGNRTQQNFADMTAYLDKMVGELVAKLDALGLRENTLILFTGDNGTGLEIRTRFKGQTYPGGKSTRTARGTHVPLIANWPGRVPAGKVSSDLVGATDFFPTLCDAAGVKLAGAAAGDGQSFWPQLCGERGRPRPWLYSWYMRSTPNVADWEYAMTARHKLYRDGTFFDLTMDPYEEKPPLPREMLTGPAAAAAKTLQAALDALAEARPVHLRPTDKNPKPTKPKKAE